MLRVCIVLVAIGGVAAAVIAASFLQPAPGSVLAITETPLPPYPKLHVARVAVARDEEFGVDVTGAFGTTSIFGFSLDVEYPPGLLQFLNCVTSPTFACSQKAAGVVRFEGATDEALTEDIDVGRIVFRASDYHCEAFLSASGRVLDQDGRDVTRSVDGGRVDIGAPSDTASGDVNCDGIDAVDAALVLQISALLIGVGDVPYWPNADVNGDGEYGAVDAFLILQKVAGLL